MIEKLILVCAMLAVSLCLFACSSGRKQVAVDISCADFYERRHISQEVEVPVSESFTVTLCSNPTTGFQWEAARISDPTVLEELEHHYVSPESKPPPPPGTPGQEVWTFKGLKEGESTISIDYSRPWEGGEKGEWTFGLTVVLRAD